MNSTRKKFVKPSMRTNPLKNSPVVVGTTSAPRSPITVSSGSQVRARAREIRPSATITTPAVSVTASSGQIGASTLPSSFI